MSYRYQISNYQFKILLDKHHYIRVLKDKRYKFIIILDSLGTSVWLNMGPQRGGKETKYMEVFQNICAQKVTKRCSKKKAKFKKKINLVRFLAFFFRLGWGSE